MKIRTPRRSVFFASLAAVVLGASSARAQQAADLANESALLEAMAGYFTNPGAAPASRSTPPAAGEGWDLLESWARQWNLPVKVQKIALAKLKDRGVAVVRLRNPDELALLEAVGSKSAMVFSSGKENIVSLTELARRYEGIALTTPQLPLQIDDAAIQSKVQTLGGTDIVQKIVIRNREDVPMEISVERTSCGCTGAEIVPRVVPPHSQGLLTMKIRADSAGRLVSILLRTSDAKQPWRTVAWNPVIPVRMARPGEIVLNGRFGAEVRSESTISVPDGARIVSASADLEWVKVRVVDKLATIRVTVPATAPAGSFRGQISCVVAGSPIKRIVVPLSGYIDGDVHATPSYINLGGAVAGQVIRKVVVFASSADHPFEISNVRSSESAISFETTGVRTGSSQEVAFIIKPIVAGHMSARAVVSLVGGRELSVDINGDVEAADLDKECNCYGQKN